jgi:hypothetical protein
VEDERKPEQPRAPEASPAQAEGAEEELKLPELQDALLDEKTVDRLFFDVKHAAELIGVAFKGGSQERASATAAGDALDQAREALRAESVLGVQLRYRHRGREWWDTLLRTPAGIRLVRIAPDFPR